MSFNIDGKTYAKTTDSFGSASLKVTQKSENIQLKLYSQAMKSIIQLIKKLL